MSLGLQTHARSKWLLISQFILFINSLFVFFSCQNIPETFKIHRNEFTGSTDEFPKRNRFIPLEQINQLTGSVSIRKEGNTIRAGVFADGQQQFEFVQLRDKPQYFLSKPVDNAKVTLLRNTDYHIMGVVIDDLANKKRYIMANNNTLAISQAKKIPTTSKFVYFIDGYGSSFSQSEVRWEDPV
jgi:hypothetical protein